MKTPSFYSDPHIQFLSQLLEEIGEGGLQVPRFQRPLVWDWERRLELLRSIRDGIPIGAIMVWRTNTVIIECYDKLGPYRLKEPPLGATRQYILDGVQRLSTLYGALHRPQSIPSEATDDLLPLEYAKDGDEPGEVGLFDVFYDPLKEDFLNPQEASDTNSLLMPISVVFDSLSLLRYQRSLAEIGSEEAINSTDKIARAFRDYKLPLIPITTDDINLATRTFQRINSQGAPMSETHMVHALTWNKDFDLQNRLLELKDQVLSERGWSSLDDDPILKACKAAFNLDVYKASADELSTAIVSNPGVLADVFDCIGRSADFLWQECGVASPDLVPYALQIVVLSEAFRINPNPSDRVRELLRAWFWMTTYGELFAGMSGDRVALAIADMHATVREEVGTWTWKRPFEERPLRPTFDFRAARAKAYAFRLAAFQDEFLADKAGTRLLADSGRKALAQIVPARIAGRAAYSSPGNRFLVPPANVHEVREQILNGNLSEQDREAHGITASAQQRLLAKDYGGFIRERTDDVKAAEHEFLQPLLREFSADARDKKSTPSPVDAILAALPIEIVEREHDRYFVILLGNLRTPITIKLSPSGDYWSFWVSHAIKTPLQIGPYWTSRPFDESQQQALWRAITGLSSYYEQAISRGYTPAEDWLVPETK